MAMSVNGLVVFWAYDVTVSNLMSQLYTKQPGFVGLVWSLGEAFILVGLGGHLLLEW